MYHKTTNDNHGKQGPYLGHEHKECGIYLDFAAQHELFKSLISKCCPMLFISWTRKVIYFTLFNNFDIEYSTELYQQTEMNSNVCFTIYKNVKGDSVDFCIGPLCIVFLTYSNQPDYSPLFNNFLYMLVTASNHVI